MLNSFEEIKSELKTLSNGKETKSILQNIDTIDKFMLNSFEEIKSELKTLSNGKETKSILQNIDESQIIQTQLIVEEIQNTETGPPVEDTHTIRAEESLVENVEETQNTETGPPVEDTHTIRAEESLVENVEETQTTKIIKDVNETQPSINILEHRVEYITQSILDSKTSKKKRTTQGKNKIKNKLNL